MWKESSYTCLLLWTSASVCVVVGVDTLRRDTEIPVRNETGVEGRTVILPCTVDNLGRHKVVWTDQWNTVLTLNEARIIDDDRISVSRRHDNEWNLQFEQVKYGDQGLYTCQINTSPTLSIPVMLSVVVPPRISSSEEAAMVTVREWSETTLTCNATGIPRPTVTWYRLPSLRGDPLESESCKPNSRVGFTGEVLVIHNVSRFCGGHYECRAENGVPPTAKQTTLVKVKFPPEVTLFNRRMGQAVGKETILECVISAYPQAEAAWRFVGRQVSSKSTDDKYRVDIFNHADDDSKLTLSLVIRNISLEDYGIYLCVASNDVGRASESMELYEHKDRTKPPPVTTTHSTTSTTVLPSHYLAKTLQPGPRHESRQSEDYKPRARDGLRLEYPDVIDTDNHQPQQSKSEASLLADNQSPTTVTRNIYVLLVTFSWIQVWQAMLM